MNTLLFHFWVYETLRISYSFSLDAKIDGVLDPGNELDGVDDADDKVDARDHHKPHKHPLTPPPLPGAGHKRSGEYER